MKSGRVWLFDLDNTLHNATPHIFPHINRSMRQYIERHLNVDKHEASRIRQDYWMRYGATLLGLIPPLSGRAEASGRVGYLAQDAHVFSTSVAENVKIGKRDASDDEVAAALAAAGLALDPGRLVGELGAPLSGGEARRLAASRVLVGEFGTLILDEPSEHLDAQTASALLDDLWASAGDRPLLAITHDPDVIARCDRVVRLDAAREASGRR